jgi:hypothetical protein
MLDKSDEGITRTTLEFYHDHNPEVLDKYDQASPSSQKEFMKRLKCKLRSPPRFLNKLFDGMTLENYMNLVPNEQAKIWAKHKAFLKHAGWRPLPEGWHADEPEEDREYQWKSLNQAEQVAAEITLKPIVEKPARPRRRNERRKVNHMLQTAQDINDGYKKCNERSGLETFVMAVFVNEVHEAGHKGGKVSDKDLQREKREILVVAPSAAHVSLTSKLVFQGTETSVSEGFLNENDFHIITNKHELEDYLQKQHESRKKKPRTQGDMGGEDSDSIFSHTKAGGENSTEVQQG